jgi:signal transduction histidine kinase
MLTEGIKRFDSGLFSCARAGVRPVGDFGLDTLDWRNVFESVAGPFLVLAPDAPRFTVVGVSEAFLRAVKRRRVDLVGRSLSQILEDDRTSFEDKDEATLHDSLVRVIQRHDGDALRPRRYSFGEERTAPCHERWWATFISPVFDENKTVRNILCRLEDVTECHARERMRTEWASLVVHDLLQPLNTISGYVQLLAQSLEACPDCRVKTYLAQIQRATELFARMVGDLRDSSQLEARRMKVERSEIDIVEIVYGTVARFPDFLARCQVKVECSPTIRAWADRDRVEQILGNLLTNADKYSDPESAIRITVSKDAGNVRIAVENRGCGILPEDLPRVFNRFERASKTRTGTIAGLGLGLYISKGLVESMGGHIAVESRPFATTTFHFTLPIARVIRSVGRYCQNDKAFSSGGLQ